MYILHIICLEEKKLLKNKPHHLIKLFSKIIDVLIKRANKFSYGAQAGLSWCLSLKIKGIKINASIYAGLENLKNIS